MSENINSTLDTSRIIETVIGPIDMAQAINGYGGDEGQVINNNASKKSAEGFGKSAKVYGGDEGQVTYNNASKKSAEGFGKSAKVYGGDEGQVTYSNASKKSAENFGGAQEQKAVIMAGAEEVQEENRPLASHEKGEGELPEEDGQRQETEGGKDGGEGEGKSENHDFLGETEKFPLPLNVYGQQVEVTMGEAVGAIQRGLAFDRVKSELAAARGDERLLALSRLSSATGKTSAQLLTQLECECVFADLEGRYGSLDDAPPEEIADAVAKISATKEGSEGAIFREKERGAKNQLREFLEENPGVTDSPESVLESTREGVTLGTAYSRYRIGALERELEEV
ncbi:MAG: hypothetical protein RR728_06645, partial [Oscillospiraceae bacterium]